jgi:CubicO group peptidase (beta-lactamase class C family)
VTLFRLIDHRQLSLDTTTGQTLGWTGDKAAITLRHLLSFTSGLRPENRCTFRPQLTLAACVNQIAGEELVASPGSRFEYGSTHLEVAGRMAEVVTGKTWNQIFAEQTLAPLGLPADMTYYSNPLRPSTTTNPLLAGGLFASMNEYEPVLRLVFDKGRWHGRQLISRALFDQQTQAPYPNADIGKTPWPGHRYGLTAWLECDHPQTGCASLSSPGAFGFTPWIDREQGYYAILGMDYRRNPRTHFGVRIEQSLKPLIEKAMKETVR